MTTPTVPSITGDTVLARLAALQTMPIADLKAQWRTLFGTEPPPFNRAYVVSRLSYRVQELAYGGLKPETVARLEALGDELEREAKEGQRPRYPERPIAGTRLIREYRGAQHTVTVTANGFEWQGRPYQSLSAIARDHRYAVERPRVLRPQVPSERQMSRRQSTTMTASVQKRRCAVYTRVSTDEGLKQEYNSLDAQRDACEAYVASQRAEGWLLLRDRYDDGGYSGGTLERPGLKRLLADIEVGRVDVVVVYKIDRLSRSLSDFSKLVDVFDRHDVTFVSVTQAFSTVTSMGRLTLNILLSFAQFEREVIGERIRDKFAASRARGMWMGGKVPLGYDVCDRKLVVNTAEAETVRMIFERFADLRSGLKLIRELQQEGVLTKTGRPIDKGYLYKLINNRTYLGDAPHKGTIHRGEHEAVVPRDLWDRVHAVLAEAPRARAGQSRNQTPALLKGVIFGLDGRALSPSHTMRKGRQY